jgi:hypothetical protein
MSVPLSLEKIVSGGQTGADRAALDFAIEHGITHGGWCPAGRFAEDGKIPAKYKLRQTPLPEYPQRTRWNVRDSDGTVIFTIRKTLVGGSLLTWHFAEICRKPCLHISERADGKTAAKKLRAFIAKHKIKVLNVAGPRASTEPRVAAFSKMVLEAALGGSEVNQDSNKTNEIPRALSNK